MRSRALVTGASGGIGETFARRLADDHDLVVVARRAERLHDLAGELRVGGTDVEVLPADLRREDGLAAVEHRLASTERPVDLLVNNAGFGTTGTFADAALERELAMVELNVVALVRLTHAALVAMGARGRGAIVNVSSLAGFQAVPGTAVYAATKAFVTNFTEAVSEEARCSGVRLQALCPGLTRTEFHEVNAFDVGWLPGVAWQSAEEVVDASLAGLERGRVVVVPGLVNRAAATASWLAPRTLVRRLVATALRR
ncbi:MAG: SDR family oxidoreductase [Actinomycetota bacterium]|nr:SDR family oxidoreductase [Actinomycetota bacterium]